MKSSIAELFSQTYGISQATAFKMCCYLKISPKKDATTVAAFKKDLAFRYLQRLNYLKGFERKNQEVSTFLYYQSIGNTKSYKFRALLPIRGQRNKTNGRTARKQALAMQKHLKKKAPQPTK